MGGVHAGYPCERLALTLDVGIGARQRTRVNVRAWGHERTADGNPVGRLPDIARARTNRTKGARAGLRRTHARAVWPTQRKHCRCRFAVGPGPRSRRPVRYVRHRNVNQAVSAQLPSTALWPHSSHGKAVRRSRMSGRARGSGVRREPDPAAQAYGAGRTAYAGSIYCAMPVDVLATCSTTPNWADDYNVLRPPPRRSPSRAAPGSCHGEAAAGRRPLLRRPFSVFEVIRDEHGARCHLAPETRRSASAPVCSSRPRGRPPRLSRALGQPFSNPSRRPRRPAGGRRVGLPLSPRSPRPLRARGTETTRFYGARRASDLQRCDIFERLRVRLDVATEDGSRGMRARSPGRSSARWPLCRPALPCASTPAGPPR